MIYDLQHEAAEACLMPNPETSEPIAISNLSPSRGTTSPGAVERSRVGLIGG
jgi:hypothetical protein